jgi:hypothetical protein
VDATQRIKDAVMTAVLTHRLSDAQLGKKNLGLYSVLVSRGGCIVCWFDVSMRYQAIKRLFFSCTRIFSPFLTPRPLTMSQRLPILRCLW